MALRPELTPTLARMVAAKGNNLKRPVRWYSIPRLFRYERMQKGRLREFYQLNMDILGIPGVSADAELIAAVIDMMRDLGFTADDFSVRISSRTLLEGLLTGVGVAQELGAVYGLLDKKHKISPEEFSQELTDIVGPGALFDKVTGVLNVQSIAQAAAICPDLAALRDLENLFTLLSHYGMDGFFAFDIGIVRGLLYYTGIVFEVFDTMRSLRAIAGGGRYDRLVQTYGGPDTPAIGFAAGDVVLGELLKQKGIIPSLPRRSEVFIVSLDQQRPQIAIALAMRMRKRGISCEFSLKQCAVGKQMEQANAARGAAVVFAGGSEEADGKLKVKIMQSGEELLLDNNDFPAETRGAIAERVIAGVRAGDGPCFDECMNTPPASFDRANPFSPAARPCGA